jgi:hypothetical protein
MLIHEKYYSRLKNSISSIVIWVFLSGLLSIIYFDTIISPNMSIIPSWFNEILNGIASSPYNYRLIAPSLFNFINSLLPFSEGKNYFITTFIIFLFSIGFLMQALTFSITNQTTIIALIYSSFFILLTVPSGGIQPWSYIDIGLYALAYLSLTRGWNILIYVAISIIAILNRETGVLLCALPILFKSFECKTGVKFLKHKKELAVLLMGCVFFLGLRFFRGHAEHVITTSQVIVTNFSPTQMIINLFVYGGAFCWFYIGKKLTLTNIEKAFLVIFLVNVILIFLFGLFREIRMFVPYVFLFGIFFSRKHS